MPNLYESDFYGGYTTPKFSDVWKSFDEFQTDANASKIPLNIKPENLETLYYLLYGRYGNAHIAGTDRQMWKYSLFSVIFQKAPTWEKRLELQDKIRNLTDDEIVAGTKAIHNTALNPGEEPTTGSLEELPYINQQNTSNYKKSKLEAYGNVMALLEKDVTAEFLYHFEHLFAICMISDTTLLYEGE